MPALPCWPTAWTGWRAVRRGRGPRTAPAGVGHAARTRVAAGLEDTSPLLPAPRVPYTELGWVRQPADCWTAPMPGMEKIDDAGQDQAMRRMWHPWLGDRRPLIGVEMAERTVRAAFDACLLTDAEMRAGPMLWQLLPDAVPAWSRG